MAAVPTGMVAVRLGDIPEKIRLRHGRAQYEAAAADRDLMTALAWHTAMHEPSDKVHWVPREAYEKAVARW